MLRLTMVYKGIQGPTRVYKSVLGYKKGMLGFTMICKGFQEYTRVYRGILGYRRIY